MSQGDNYHSMKKATAPITFVSFLWNDGFRDYQPYQVNMQARALRHFCTFPHRYVCVSDVLEGFSREVEVLPMPSEAARMGSLSAPQGKQFPSSYRRLWCFSEEAKILGERIMLLDIDAMILKNLSPLLQIDADFVGWRPMSIWGREDRIGGGTWMLRTGALTSVWERFCANPSGLIAETLKMGWTGSDQAILSRFLVKDYPTWPRYCGIYGSQDGVFEWEKPPEDALIVHFNGDGKMWGQNKLWMRAYCNYFGEKDGIV